MEKTKEGERAHICAYIFFLGMDTAVKATLHEFPVDHLMSERTFLCHLTADRSADLYRCTYGTLRAP